MSTAQQLGLIGNSVKVQSLPTASAETFGAGNRFYTLIGQQEGYITGHTYRTVVANDVYSWEDVAGITDYNQIENIPVINQDLSASGFTPVANTYYRHTGATTDTFTQGVIYLYDTAYHKLGESGGGTTLNKYTYTIEETNSGITREQANTLARILENAKSIKETQLIFSNTVIKYAKGTFLQGRYSTYGVINGHFVCSTYINNEYRLVIGYVELLTITSDFQFSNLISVSLVDKSILTYEKSKVLGLSIIYYNDIEIT